MGKWGVGLLVGICVAGAAACSSGSGPDPIAPRVAGVRFPQSAAVDPGVLRVGPLPTARNPDFPQTTPGGLRLTLDRCELRAPGTWVFSGRIALPHGKDDVTATLDLGFANGDLGRGTWAHEVTFTKSGSFAVTVPGPMAPKGDPRRPFDDGVSNCSADILASSVPVADPSAFLAPSAARAPFVYRAPIGSLQTFGIGAPLGKPSDPRTVSLYTVWSGGRSPITDAYVPVVAGERPALVSMGASNSVCSKITVAIGPADGDPADQITVTTRMGCGAPVDDDQRVVPTSEPVAGAHGFTWAHPAYRGDPDVAIHTIGNIAVWVQGGASVARTTVAHVAATLTTATNSALTSGPIAKRPQSLDSAVKGFIRENPGTTERARFPYRGGWMIFIDTGAGTPYHRYQLVRAGQVFSGWWVEKLGAGGGHCFDAPSYSTGDSGQDRFAFSITGDPHWGIQSFVDGQWRTIPSTNGVEFEDATVPHPAPFPLRERPVDGTGHVPPCFD